MDATYYQNNLKFLYESSDKTKPPVYNVDNLLFSYISQDTFNNNISPSVFFTPVINIKLKGENINDVSIRANAVETNYISLPTNQNFIDDATNNEVRIDIINGEHEEQLSSSIIKKIADDLTNNINNINDITKSHRAFDIYMRGIISSVCLGKMKDALKFIIPITNINNIPNNLNIACNTIDQISSQKKDILFNIISDTCKQKLINIILQLPQINFDILNDINNRSVNSFSHPLYYQLRSAIIDDLVIPSSVIIDQDDYIFLYIKRIITDIYIKTSYPLIHYDFIDAMMQKYALKGDYINIRLALLAKVFFTFYFMDYINKYIYTPNNITGDGATISQINTNLNNYLISLNNIDISSEPGKNTLSEIITSLHDLSSDVVIQSKDIYGLKTEIDSNQQALRNIIANSKFSNEQLRRQIIEFWILFSILIIIVLVSAILIFIKKSQFVLYINGLILIIVIIMKIVLMIKSFIIQN